MSPSRRDRSAGRRRHRLYDRRHDFARRGNATKLSVKRLFRLVAPDTLVVEGTMVQAGQSRAVATVYKKVCRDPMLASATAPAADRCDARPNRDNRRRRVDRRRLDRRNEFGDRRALDTARRAGRCWRYFPHAPEQRDVRVRVPLHRRTEGGWSTRRCPTRACRRRQTSRLTQVTPDSATFENPSHDFPEDDSLLAESFRRIARDDDAGDGGRPAPSVGGVEETVAATFVPFRRSYELQHAVRRRKAPGGRRSCRRQRVELRRALSRV